MEYRSIEKLGVQTSLLGFGCMRFPTLASGAIDEAEAESLLDLAIGQGVNYIDTAYMYHDGKSEEFVGKVLKKYRREQIHLATKMPMVTVESLAQAKEIFAEQLDRLQTDYFDFYLLHALDAKKWAKTLELGVLTFLEEMKAAGKIKYLGFSFHDTYDVFEKILTYRPWEFCQIQLNYMDTEHQQGIRGYELAEKLGVPVIVMEPVKGGALAALPEDIAKLLRRGGENATLASWALRWAASLPQVKVVLSGMSARAQVEDNLTTFSSFQALSEAENRLISLAAAKIREKTKNGCTACAYCMPCPFGVDIPKCFKIWNEQAMYRLPQRTKQAYYTMMKKEQRADQCRQCGQCEKLCPQQIAIREDLSRAARDLSAEHL